MPKNTFGERHEWNNPGTFYQCTLLILLSTVILVPYITNPVCTRGWWKPPYFPSRPHQKERKLPTCHNLHPHKAAASYCSCSRSCSFSETGLLPLNQAQSWVLKLWSSKKGSKTMARTAHWRQSTPSQGILLNRYNTFCLLVNIWYLISLTWEAHMEIWGLVPCFIWNRKAFKKHNWKWKI